MTVSTTTFANLPFAPLLSGAEIVPIDAPNGDGTFTTKKTTIGAIGAFPVSGAPFATVGGTGGFPAGRQLAGTAGDIVLTDGGAGQTAAFSLAPVGSAGTFGDASHVLAITVDTKGRVTQITSRALAVANVSGAAPLDSPAFTTAATLNGAALATQMWVTGLGYVTASGAAASAPVQSVAGRTGTVTLTSGDLTDATTVGKALVAAASQSAGRSALAAAASGSNSDITSLSGLTTALSVGQGGTGATTQSAARTGIGAAASGANTDITSLAGLTTPLSASQGGTGNAGGAWTAFTPAITSSGGSGVAIVAGGSSGAYVIEGKKLFFRATVQINYSTAPTSISLTFPASASAKGNVTVPAVNISSGVSLIAYSPATSTSVSITRYDATSPLGASGQIIVVSGVVEIA